MLKKIINYSWNCAAAQHQRHNFGVAVYDDDDSEMHSIKYFKKLSRNKTYNGINSIQF